MDEITTVEQATAALEVGIRETLEDQPDLSEDEIWHDIVVAIAFQIESDDVAREFCRTQLGSIPYDLEGRLGRKDWIQ